MVLRKQKDYLDHPTETLIASAFDGEIDHLLGSKAFPHIKSFGIGNLEAALCLMEYLRAHPEIRSVIFLGSCGAYPWSKFKTGEMVSINKVHSLEVSAYLGHSKQIRARATSISFQSPAQIFHSAICNAPASLTLAQLQTPPSEEWSEIDVENLELFGIARVCEILNITLTSHLCITNLVGPNGSIDWQKNWRAMSSALQEHFKNL
jgi:nucleoside phosphorylase